MASSNAVYFSDDELSDNFEESKQIVQEAMTAVHPVAYADETLDTQVLLTSWNIKKDIISTVVAAKLTIWHLRVIEDDDIARLFGTNIADCVEFKYYLKKWRNEGAKLVEIPQRSQIKSIPLLPSPIEPPDPLGQPSLQTNAPAKAKWKIPEWDFDERKHSSIEDVEKILKMSARGRSIVQYYRTNQKLETQHQAWMVDIIAEFYLQKYESVSMKMMDRISDKIVELFPTEQKSTYYTKRPIGGNPKGKLHDKFRNKRRLYIAQGILKRKSI
ncbi:uncharacterized protein LOC132255667 [Phlebotomus argentipes]|uniref:uncharacterized protein LOC132255667 n=1 Tax=Phlebotomus argentipes TaxID=94469 RepID=UPI0028935866|nr:uncharacterized protein LOC132255667 [Phlebotomus argentipes]